LTARLLAGSSGPSRNIERLGFQLAYTRVSLMSDG